jgi:SPP1 gp7 family putative phage head morphogenesis protein
MAKKPSPPILPRNQEDPLGVDRLERGAMREFRVRVRRITKATIRLLDRVPVEPAVNRRYTFQLDRFLLDSLMSSLDLEVQQILIGNDPNGGTWLFDAYVEIAYQRGTAQEFASLAQQSPAYRGGQQDLASILRSDPYQRRIALIRSRVYEEMRLLEDNVRADMGRILTEGMGRGLNPIEIARNLTQQTGINERRANRIARTEITTALRRARMDEADDATERYGLQTKQMHMSALLPTTRRTHAQRHAKLFTTDEQRDWWAEDGNSINCRCGTVSVLVDADGKPLVPGIQERARENYQVMAAREDSKWTKE